MKNRTIDWYWRLVNPKLEKKNYTFRKPTKNKTRCFFLLRGQKWVLYNFEQSKLTPSFWISLIRENFARKLYFSKLRPTITTVNMTFSSFFGTLCSNRLFPKKHLKFSLKKYLKRRSILFACEIQDNRLLLKIGKSKIEKKLHLPKPDKN